MAAKQEIRIAENISNQAENRWEKTAQNKLATEIGDATKTKLEDLKDKIPVRVVEKGDTIGAIILGMKKAGVEGLAGQNIWGLEVEYHSESGKTKTLKLAQAAKLFPGDEVSFDGEKVIVKSAVRQQEHVEDSSQNLAESASEKAKLECDALEKILANPQITRVQILEALEAAVLASADYEQLSKSKRNKNTENLFTKARERLAELSIEIPADFKDATKAEKDIIRQLIGLGFTVEKKHSGEAEKVVLYRDGNILEIASASQGLEAALKKLQAKALKSPVEKPAESSKADIEKLNSILAQDNNRVIDKFLGSLGLGRADLNNLAGNNKATFSFAKDDFTILREKNIGNGVTLGQIDAFEFAKLPEKDQKQRVLVSADVVLGGYQRASLEVKDFFADSFNINQFSDRAVSYFENDNAERSFQRVRHEGKVLWQGEVLLAKNKEKVVIENGKIFKMVGGKVAEIPRDKISAVDQEILKKAGI